MMGRLTKDPDIRMTQNNKAVASFTIAVDRRFKQDGQPTADFFNCTAFGKTAEFVEKYLTKGVKVVICGELRNNHYEKDGVKHYSEQIMIESIEFAESKRASEENAGNATPAPSDGFTDVPNVIEDELPFV
jgi:single-strand DNA-binding protein